MAFSRVIISPLKSSAWSKGCTPQTDHDLYHLPVDPVAAVMICCAGSVTVEYGIQLRKHVPDHADLTACTGRHELDRTDIP